MHGTYFLSLGISLIRVEKGTAPTMICLSALDGMRVTPTPIKSNFCVRMYDCLSSIREYLSPKDDTILVPNFMSLSSFKEEDG